MEGNNVFRRMLWIVLLVLCCGSLFAQQKKLTIDLKNGSFAQLTDLIKKQSKYTFFFNNAMLSNLKRLTIQVNEVSIDSVLNLALKGSELTYKLKDNTVILAAHLALDAAQPVGKGAVLLRGTVLVAAAGGGDAFGGHSGCVNGRSCGSFGPRTFMRCWKSRRGLKTR